MNVARFCWELDDKDPMKVIIFMNNIEVMSIYLGEAIEAAGREAITKCIKEIESSPWIRQWHKQV